MRPLRRAASALLALGLALGAFTASPAPVRAESENAGELGAVIFAFDFSRSIYCTYAGATPENCTKIGPDLAAAVQGLANDVAKNSQAYSERKVTFQVVEFGKKAFVVESSSGTCKGNTGNPGGTALLVTCLEQVATDYSLSDSPRAELYDTFYFPPLQIVREIEGSRCGIILFTDGKPKDPAKASTLAEKLGCAVLPVSTGDPDEIDQDYLEDIAKPELIASEGCAQSGPFMWPDVYFETAQEAVDAIGLALDRVACPPRVPPLDKCMTVSAYEQAIIAVELVPIRIGNTEDDSFVTETAPVIGTKLPRGSEVEITSQEAPPPGCEGPPQPVVVPDMVCKAPADAQGLLSEIGLLWQAVGQSDDSYVISHDPVAGSSVEPGTTVVGTTGVAGEGCGCKVESILDWIICNLLWLVPLLLLLLGSRWWWVHRDLQVSVNGQPAVGLRGGTHVGFNVYEGGRTERVPNPASAKVQVTRSFFRFLPGTRIEANSLPGAQADRGTKFRLGEVVALTPDVRARFSHGHPRRQVRPSGSSSSGSKDSGISSVV